jgi:hypothetical protein
MVARLVLAGASVSTRDSIVALCDAILRSTGYQAFNEATGLGAANNAASTSFGTVGNTTSTGFSDYTFVASVAKVYLVRVHVCFFCSVFAAGDFVGWQLKNTTLGTTAPNATAAVFPSAANQRITATFDFPLAMQAGNNVLQMQWRSGTAGTTANVNTGDFRRFTVMG